jgi:hypothetical protein
VNICSSSEQVAAEVSTSFLHGRRKNWQIGCEIVKKTEIYSSRESKIPLINGKCLTFGKFCGKKNRSRVHLSLQLAIVKRFKEICNRYFAKIKCFVINREAKLEYGRNLIPNSKPPYAWVLVALSRKKATKTKKKS